MPAAVSQIGASECAVLRWHLRLRLLDRCRWAAPSFEELDLARDCGVFPRSPEVLHRWASTYLQKLPLLDHCAVGLHPGESLVVGRFCAKAKRIAPRALESFFFTNPWSSALRGKKVVVIHSFEDAIRQQYNRREEIWPRGAAAVLPRFDLRTIRAPSAACRHDYPDSLSMLHGLESELERCRNTEGFDVALIGCGAAGLPLAVRAKELGGIGIDLGPSLPLLFGIRGEREDRPEYRRFMNDAWGRPWVGETPR